MNTAKEGLFVLTVMQPWHLAPPGAHVCDCGSSASETVCAEAVLRVAGANGNTPGRSMQTGSGGTCRDDSWGGVPVGCSAQSGGDWTAHFKSGPDTGEGCIYEMYQLICSGLSCTTAATTATISTTRSKLVVEQARLDFGSLINTA